MGQLFAVEVMPKAQFGVSPGLLTSVLAMDLALGDDAGISTLDFGTESSDPRLAWTGLKQRRPPLALGDRHTSSHHQLNHPGVNWILCAG